MILASCRAATTMRAVSIALVAMLMGCHIFLGGVCAMVSTAIAGSPAFAQEAYLHMDMPGGCPDSLVNAENREFPHGELVATLPEADTPRLHGPGSLVSTWVESQTCTPLHVMLLPVLRI